MRKLLAFTALCLSLSTAFAEVESVPTEEQTPNAAQRGLRARRCDVMYAVCGTSQQCERQRAVCKTLPLR